MVGLRDTLEQKRGGGIVGHSRAEEEWWDCGIHKSRRGVVGLWDTVEQKRGGGIMGHIRAEEGWWD